jgi:7-keto-8-aminopelargonate synthetase-like enzyme
LESAKKYSTGNHGPRMLCGNLVILEDLEREIAKFFNREAALVFNSGYLACMSVIAGFTRKDDFILMDKLNHASLKAGVKVSPVGFAHYFKHNNFEDAERLIKSKMKRGQRVVMIIESIYSMDGDVGDISKARILCDKYDGILIVDEAHGLGTVGKTGRGVEEMYEFKYRADIICGTFSKSLASCGGFITCSADLRTYFTLYAPGLVFSAPCSAYNAGAAHKALQILQQEPERVTKVQENSKYLRERFIENGFNIGQSTTCVIPVTFDDIVLVINLHAYFEKRGYFTAAVMAPACPVLEPRFRITPNCTMNKQDLDDIINLFIDGRRECKGHPAFQELKEIL